MGTVLAVCTSAEKGTPKQNIGEAYFRENWGIPDDAHAGPWHRQVSLLSAERIAAFRRKLWVEYGAFGENLVVEGFDFRQYPIGTRFQCGSVLLELTQIGKQCHSDCAIKQQTGACIMPANGVFARVLRGGRICAGDQMTVCPAAASSGNPD